MRFNILSIGKFKQNDSYKQIFNEYKKRLKWSLALKELNVKKKVQGDLLKKAEAELFKKNLDKNSKIIALDERGKNVTSPEFADLIKKYQQEGISSIDFLIGGAEGLDPEMRKEADYVLSLGKMVFPHLMVRVILTEQLYRAYTILNNHPYHK